MAAVLMDECKTYLMNDRLAGMFWGNLRMDLLQGVLPTIDHTMNYSVLSANTASWVGYAPQSPTSWGVSGPDADFNILGISNPLTFTNSGFPPQTVTGWYLWNATFNVLLDAAAFQVPVTIPGSGGVYTTPAIWLINGPLS